MPRDIFKRKRGSAAASDNGKEDDDVVLDLRAWQDAPALRLSDIDPAPAAAARPQVSTTDRAAAYADWAARMQEKREKSRQRIAEARGEAGSAPEATYWTTEAFFAQSRHLDEQELLDQPDPERVNELLAVLDLPVGSSKDDIVSAYKRLAKAHHPDRYATADDATRDFHADRMMSINKAYSALRHLELA